MKVNFYLLGYKALSALEEFCRTFGAADIGFVVAAKDNAIANDFFIEIKKVCEDLDIVFYEKNAPDDIDTYSSYSFAIGWRWLIKNEENLIVFHDSILPKYRGFSPLVNMLINGENEIGVTALLASDKYDAGNIVAQEKIKISYPILIQEAIELVSPLYKNLLLRTYKMILLQGAVFNKEQDETLATYSLWRDENDYFIDWTQSSESISRFCDSVGYPYKGACAEANGHVIRVLRAEEYPDVVVESRKDNIGKVIFFENESPIIICAIGLLKITEYLNNGKSIGFRTRLRGKGSDTI